MKILGIQINHNSSACLFDDKQLIYYNQEERLCRKKNSGTIPYCCLLEIKEITTKVDLVIFTSYNFEIDFFSSTLEFIKDYVGIQVDEWFCYYKPHHISHAYKSFFSSGFEESLVFVTDGRGSTFTLDDGSVAFETSTVFYISENGKKCKPIHKKLYTESENLGKNRLNLSNVENNGKIIQFEDNFTFDLLSGVPDIGNYYIHATEFFGWGEHDSGKLMGLHSYGKENYEISNLVYDDNRFKLDISDSNVVNSYNFLNKNNKDFIDFSYSIQKGFEKIQLNFVKDILSKNISNNIIFTGGCALNIVANSFIRKNIPQNINLYVEPLCGDEGNSIGACQLYYSNQFGINPKIPNTIYLSGKNPEYQFNLDNGEELISDIDYSFICDLLISGKIVAIFQGKSEAGPRALGNRSIIFDPRIKNGKDIVNVVKKREKFRPFACSVLFEECHNWFDMSYVKESPYMMYSFDALPGVREVIPSVIHVDNTSRVQTVTQEQNYHYYNLIKEFFNKTSVPILFNTSFNLAGDPIVETLEDALNTLRKSELEYLYLPEIGKIVYIKN